MRLDKWSIVGLLLVGLAGGGVISGCGSGSNKPQSIASPERVTQIVEMRKLFEKAGGNWDSLSADDKAQYTKLAGDEAKAQAMWKTMSAPGGAVPQGN